MEYLFKKLQIFPSIVGDGTDENILAIINIITISNIIYLPVLIVGNLIGGKTPIGVFLLDILGIIFSIILRKRSTKANAKQSVLIVLISGFFIISIVCAQLGTVRSPTTTGYLFLVLIAGLAYGLPGIFASCIICSAGVLGLVIAEQYHFLPTPDLSITATQWITFTAWFVLMGSVSYASQKSVKNSLSLAYQEITEKNKFADALMISEKQYRLISEHAADVIWVLDFTTSKFTYISPSILKLRGYTPEEVLEQPIHLSMTSASFQHFLDMVKNQIVLFKDDHNQNTFLDEFDQIHRDGSIISTEIKSSLIINEGGGIDIISVSRDISERKEQEEAKKANENRYRRAITAANAVPYIRIYSQNNYAFMGDGIEKMTGYSVNEISPSIFFSRVHNANVLGGLSHLSPEEALKYVRTDSNGIMETLQFDYQFMNKNSEFHWIQDSSVQILGANGLPIGSLGILWDVTDRKMLENTLRESRDRMSEANTALEKASRIKDEFLANMSHELRTPMNGMLTWSESLLLNTYGELTEKQVRAIKNIQNSGRHLLSLINDILDLSKIEAGKIDIINQPSQIAEICQASLQLTKGMAYQKKQSVSFSINMEGIIIRSDQRRIKQILVNLLSNAIKYTHNEGSLGLDVEAIPEKEIIRFTVWDTGIGIKEEDFPRLFQPFVQLDSSLSRQSDGTGLGLALVKKLTELLGGSIGVTSKSGEGSRFTITLNWNPVDMPPVNSSLYTGYFRSAVVIDDDQNFRSDLKKILENIGLKILQSNSAENFLISDFHSEPDILFFTIENQQRLNFIDQFRLPDSTNKMPIVIITNELDTNKYYSKEGSLYLQKPIDNEFLIKELNRLSYLISLGKNKIRKAKPVYSGKKY